MKKVTAGEFQPMIDGRINGELPPLGSWIEVLWPDLTITTHRVEADRPESLLRGVAIDYHGFKLGVLLCSLPSKARYVQWVDEAEDAQTSGG